jgi:hypothetical protein
MNDPTRHWHEPLSQAGTARRQAMLGELTQTMVRVHRIRRVRRRSLGALTVVFLLGVTGLLLQPVLFTSSNQPRIATGPQATPSDVAEITPGSVQFVTTSGSSMDGYVVASPPTVVQIDDRALLRTLASMGRPTGLIRYGDRVVLTGAVTDVAQDPQRQDQSPSGDVRRASPGSAT